MGGRHARSQHPASGAELHPQFGLSPHAYMTGRRIDAARHLLLRGAAPADVAAAVGFYDQAHFTRHFRRHTATTPSSYARSHQRRWLREHG